jgi:hypothetical protein
MAVLVLSVGAPAEDPAPRFGLAPLIAAPDAALVESLIAHGLPRLAVRLCESRLPLHAHDSDAYAQWVMLVMHAQASEALQAFDATQRIEDVPAIQDLMAQRTATTPDSPRHAWVEWKGIWCRWYLQQRVLAAYLAVPSREPLRDWILAEVRAGLDQIDALETKVRSLQASPGVRGSETRAFVTNSQILDLRGSLDLLKSDLLYQRAQCYPQASDDRIAAATEMLSSLERGLAKLPGDWLHRPALSMAQANALILLGRSDEALQKLQALWEQLAREETRNAEYAQYQRGAAAIAVRAARELSRWDQADLWLERGGGWTSHPELALEYFGCVIRREGNAAAERALQIKREIGVRFGPYWEQRADAILVSSPSLRPGGAEAATPSDNAGLELLRIEVRQLLAAKRWREAIEKLRQAQVAAERAGSIAEAFAFAMQVAAVFENQGQRTEAADAFFHAANQFPSQPKAPAAALMGAWLVRETDGQASESTAARLQAVWQQWPDSQEAEQAIGWLERDGWSQDQGSEMLDLWTHRLAAASATGDPSPASLAPRGTSRWLLGYCLSQDDWLERAREPDTPLRASMAPLRQALLDASKPAERERWSAWFSALGSDLRWPTDLPALDANSTMGAIAHLASGPWPPTRDAASLETPMQAWADDPLGRVAVLWFACEFRVALALHGTDTSRVDACKALVVLSDALAGAIQDERGVPLGPATLAKLERCLAFYPLLAQGTLGDRAASVAGLAKLRSENKKSSWWLVRTARALQSWEPHRAEAVALYRQLAAGLPAGSEPWLEARARTAQTLRAMGKAHDADQLRDLVMATYPQSADLWRSRFESN